MWFIIKVEATKEEISSVVRRYSRSSQLQKKRNQMWFIATVVVTKEDVQSVVHQIDNR